MALENAEEEVKSVGNSVTCPRDLQTAGEVWSVLLLVAESVSRRLREKQLCAGLVTVTIKDNRFSYTEHSRRPGIQLPGFHRSGPGGDGGLSGAVPLGSSGAGGGTACHRAHR